MASQRERAITRVIMDDFSIAISGFIQRLINMPVEEGESQIRPSLPFPNVCISDTTRKSLFKLSAIDFA